MYVFYYNLISQIFYIPDKFIKKIKKSRAWNIGTKART